MKLLALALFAGLFLAQPPTAHADSCDYYLDNWVISYDAWADTQCDDLTWDEWQYMTAKYGSRWTILHDPVSWHPDGFVDSFWAADSTGRRVSYEGPWVQLRTAAGCVQLDNVYWQGP